MKRITKRENQTIRFLKWVQQYPGWWHLICTPDDAHMNIDMMYKLIRHLAQKQLYEMIFVLLMVHRKEKYVKEVFNFMLLDMTIANWSGKRKDRRQIITNLLEYFE